MAITEQEALDFTTKALSEGISEDTIKMVLAEKGYGQDEPGVVKKAATQVRQKIIDPFVSSANMLLNEPAGMMAGGLRGVLELAAQPLRYAGVPGFNQPKNIDEIVAAMQQTQNQPIFQRYKPTSEFGEIASEAQHYPFEKLAEGIDWVGSGIAEATGSPLAGALSAGAATVATMAAGAKAGKALGDRFGKVKEGKLTKEVAKELESEKNMVADLIEESQKAQSKNLETLKFERNAGIPTQVTKEITQRAGKDTGPTVSREGTLGTTTLDVNKEGQPVIGEMPGMRLTEDTTPIGQGMEFDPLNRISAGIQGRMKDVQLAQNREAVKADLIRRNVESLDEARKAKEVDEAYKQKDKQELFARQDYLDSIRQAKVEDLINNRTIMGTAIEGARANAKYKGQRGPGAFQRGAVDPNVFKEGIVRLAKTLTENDFVDTIAKKYGPEFAKGAMTLYKQANTDNLESIKARAYRNLEVPEFERTVARETIEYMHKLTTGEDPVKTMAEVTKRFEDLGKTGEQTWKNTEEMARNLGYSPRRLAAVKQGTAWNAAQLEFANMTVRNSAQHLIDTAKKAAVEPSPQNLVDVHKMMTIHAGLAKNFLGLKSEAGRALNILRKAPATHARQAKFFQDMLDSVGGRMKTEQMIEMILQAEKMSPEDMQRTLMKLDRAKPMDVFRELYINTKLSFKSIPVNLLGNVSAFATAFGERAVAAGIGDIKNLGVKMGIYDILNWEKPKDRVYWKELPAIAHATIGAAPRAFELAKEAWRTEASIDPLTKKELGHVPAVTAERLGYDPNTLSGKIIDKSGRVIRMPSRAMISVDEFFKTIAFDTEVRAQLIRKGMSEGKKYGPELDKYVDQQLKDLPENIIDDAREFSREHTFTKQLGETGLAIQHALGRHYAGIFLAPFFRTPVNLIKYGYGRTPLAMMTKGFWNDLKEGGAKGDIAMGKVAFGTGLLAYIGYLYGQGYISDGGPIDPRLQSNWRSENLPYAFRFSNEPIDDPIFGRLDKWRGLGRLDPWAGPIGMTTDFLRVMKEASKYFDDYKSFSDFIEHSEKFVGSSEFSDMVKETSIGLMYMFINGVVNKTWMQNIAEVFDAMRNPNLHGEDAAHKLVGSLSPSLMNQWRRENDPILRETHSLVDALKNKWVEVSKELLPKRDVWGEPIGIEKEFPADQFAHIQDVKTPSNDPVRKMVIDMKLPLVKPSKWVTVGDLRYELTPQELDWLEENAGKEAHELIKQNVLPMYGKESPFITTKKVEAYIEGARQKYRSQLIPGILQDKERQAKAEKKVPGYSDLFGGNVMREN